MVSTPALLSLYWSQRKWRAQGRTICVVWSLSVTQAATKAQLSVWEEALVQAAPEWARGSPRTESLARSLFKYSTSSALGARGMFFSSVQTFQYPGTCSGPGPPPAAMLTATVHCCFDFPSPCKLSTSVFCTILLRCWGHVTLQCYFVYSYLGLMEIYHKRPSLLQGKEALTRHLSVPSPLPSNLIRSLCVNGWR